MTKKQFNNADKTSSHKDHIEVHKKFLIEVAKTKKIINELFYSPEEIAYGESNLNKMTKTTLGKLVGLTERKK